MRSPSLLIILLSLVPCHSVFITSDLFNALEEALLNDTTNLITLRQLFYSPRFFSADTVEIRICGCSFTVNSIKGDLEPRKIEFAFEFLYIITTRCIIQKNELDQHLLKLKIHLNIILATTVYPSISLIILIPMNISNYLLTLRDFLRESSKHLSTSRFIY